MDVHLYTATRYAKCYIRCCSKVEPQKAVCKKIKSVQISKFIQISELSDKGLA